MVSSFTWTLDSGSLNPAPAGSTVTTFAGSSGPRKQQFVRGIKFANVPDSNALNVVHGGPRVWHVNSIQTTYMKPIHAFSINGAVNSRFRDIRKIPIPLAVSISEYRDVDVFGNETLNISGSM